MADPGSSRACRGRRRGPSWTKVDHGLYRPSSEDAGRHADLLAWRLVLPPSGAFTHLTAATEYGWWLPPVPTDLPVFATVARHESRPQRSRLRVSRVAAGVPSAEVDGVPLASPPETLLACSRDLGLLDLVVLADAALHLGHTTRAELEGLARQRRAGAPQLRRASALVDERSESAWESVLRMLHVACDVPVEPQYVVEDETGLFVARGDLRLAGVQVLHEYDGEDHLRRSRQRKDLRRLRHLGDAGWLRRGYTSVEVLHQAVGILRDADRSLGRPHRPERVRAWYALLAESLFTPHGTAALRRRWGLPGAAAMGGDRTAPRP